MSRQERAAGLAGHKRPAADAPPMLAGQRVRRTASLEHLARTAPAAETTRTPAPAISDNDGSDAPQKGITCSIARYAFDAYDDAPTHRRPYVRCTAGPASVTFLDEAFVQQNLNCPGGGLIEVKFTDASSLLQQSFAAAELSVELCSLNSSGSNRISAAVRRSATPGRPQLWGGAVKVSPPSSKAPILMGVRDKTQDVLHLTLYDSDGPSAGAGAGASAAAPARRYVATIQLSDVPEGANVPPAVKVVRLQQQQEEEGEHQAQTFGNIAAGAVQAAATTAAAASTTAAVAAVATAVAAATNTTAIATSTAAAVGTATTTAAVGAAATTAAVGTATAAVGTAAANSAPTLSTPLLAEAKVSFTWRLIPFSACEHLAQQQQQQQLDRRLLGGVPEDREDMRIAEMQINRLLPEESEDMRIDEIRGVTAIVRDLCDDDTLPKSAEAALKKAEDLAHREQQQRLQAATSPNWNALNLAAGGPNLQHQQQAATSPNWDALSQAAGGPNLKPLAVVQCAGKTTQLWIFRDSTDGRVVVSFRGTVSWSNWSGINLKIGFEQPVDLNPVGTSTQQVLAHKGFLEAYLEMREVIMDILGALVYGSPSSGNTAAAGAAATTTHTPTAAAGATGAAAPAAAGASGVKGGVDGPPSTTTTPTPTASTPTRVIFTGHSLGGAMATLAAYDLAARKTDGFFSGDVQLYTFGSPRVGNQAFMEAFNNMVPNAWRFTNTDDIVPRVPYSWRFDGARTTYYHVGAHWDLEKPEADPALRVGLAADSGDQRALIRNWTPWALYKDIIAHLGPAYYSGVKGFFNLGGGQN
ncbi:hypothetical protein PLESTB_001325800 [Pleodorina starrii]|uniref:Fungal lipase-type domain-containing protein n=1 Tax=Pleodorina starrii TaxID=330485 RepID=A0A9W6BTZ9_9CHLO|nr:hypothetical protein PLESTB_001325800 [Pleodorina starrii]